MLITQQPAYVLHARPYRETSLLLECLTRDHGRLGVVARGVRRARATTAAADLQPFRRLALTFVLRGELATLRAAEPVGPSRPLEGTTLFAGLYVNELVVRLSAREDADGGLFDTYAQTLDRLTAEPEALAWTLRRFERDALAALGYAMELAVDAQRDEPLEAAAEYVYVPEQGPLRAMPGQPGLRVRGADLLGLGNDRPPDAEGLERLRRLLRGIVLHHLGGKPLRSWQVFGGSATR
ncbi:MAG TPA: DNA repair protein RecO [Rhodanobacteraceae bacterium]